MEITNYTFKQVDINTWYWTVAHLHCILTSKLGISFIHAIIVHNVILLAKKYQVD